MFSPCGFFHILGFLPQSKHMHGVTVTGESELAIGVNVNGCPSPLMWKKMVGSKDGQTE